MSETPPSPRSGASPSGIQELTRPLQPQFEALDRFLEAQVLEFEPEVQPLVRYTFQHSGKKIRPILVFFGGWKECWSEQEESDLLRAAAIVELIHLATLVHDDILDGADMRHRTETVARRYGPHAAVLLGDALFAHALKLASDFPTVEVCRLVSRATRQVCSGEIAQTFARGDAGISIEAYYRMIDLKTAELFAVSAQLGASLAGFDRECVSAVEAAARHLGIAYQIFDDMADLVGREEKAGKTLGTDLESGKYTLPFLLHLDALPALDARRLRENWQQGELDWPRLQEKFASNGVFKGVKDAFDSELDKLNAALAPFAGTGPAERIPQLAFFVKAAYARLA